MSNIGNILAKNRPTSISAVQLAEFTGLRPQDIHYWCQKGYLKRSRNGSKTPFSTNDIEKVLLMKELTKRYELKARAASNLADEIIEMYEDKPDSYMAALGLLECFDKGIEVVAKELAKLNWEDHLQNSGLLQGDNPISELIQAARKAKADTS